MGQLCLLQFSNAVRSVDLTVPIQSDGILKSRSSISLIGCNANFSDPLPFLRALTTLLLKAFKNQAFDGAHNNMKTLHTLIPQLLDPAGTVRLSPYLSCEGHSCSSADVHRC